VTRIRTSAATALMCSAAALMSVAADAPLAAQQMLGPKDGAGLPPTEIDRVHVGSVAPDFTLASLGGPAMSLSDYRGKKNVILIFYRGHW